MLKTLNIYLYYHFYNLGLVESADGLYSSFTILYIWVIRVNIVDGDNLIVFSMFLYTLNACANLIKASCRVWFNCVSGRVMQKFNHHIC